MGFGHEWSFDKTFSATEWDEIEAEAQILFDELAPAHARRKAARLNAHGSFAKLASKAISILAGPTPLPAIPCGASLFAAGPDGSRRMEFQNGTPAECLCKVEIANALGNQYAKTNAQFHDRLLIGVLCLAEEKRPGSVNICQTDAEEGHWTCSADWAGEVLGRTLPLPNGIEEQHARKARIEKAALLMDTPPAPAKSKPLRV